MNQVFRYPAFTRASSVFLSMLMAGLAVGSLLGGGGIVLGGDAAGLTLVVLGLICLPLALYIGRDARAKLGWHVEVGDEFLGLKLPEDRSFLSRPDRYVGVIPLSQIARVEKRDENYSMMGMTITVETWALKLKSGERILLGEDRPIPRSYLTTEHISPAGMAVAKAAGMKPVTLSGAHGSAGFLGIVGTKPPPWPEQKRP